MRKQNELLSKDQLEYLARARVARLATSDRLGKQSLVPIVFANNEESIYFVIDNKTKRSEKMLQRLRNIVENPSVRFLVDHYAEDWSKLSFLLLDCRGSIVVTATEKQLAAELLKEKYVQYRTGGYFPEKIKEAVIVKLLPRKAVFWQNLHPSLA